MDDNGQTGGSSRRVWLKRMGLGLGIFLLLLIVFHRPILQTVVRRAAIHFAAKENLRLELRVEGSVLGGMTLRNVRAVAIGPSALQSLDADLLRADYSLWGLLRHGTSEFLQNVELRNATVVLDPARAPPKIEPEENQKFTLPAFFPDRLTLSNVDVRMASQPNDILIQGLSLELNPKQAGELRIGKLQLATGRTWTDVTAQTTYENRNLFLRNLVLDEQTKLDVVNVDASQIGANQLAVGVKGTVAGGKIDTTMSLGAKEGSMETKIDLNVEETSLETVRKYLQPAAAAQKEDPATAIADATEAAAKEGAEAAGAQSLEPAGPIPPGVNGDVRTLSIKLTGRADQPNSWNGTVQGRIENLEAAGVTFDRADIDINARDGRAEINNVELTRGSNKITLRGTAELPETVGGLGHQPGTIQLRAQLPALGEITAGMPQPITGSAEVNGEVKVGDGTVTADIAMVGGPIDFGQGTVQRVVVKLNATKVMPPPDQQRPYFEGLTSEIGLDFTELRANDFAIDSVAGTIRTNGQTAHVEQLIVNRADNRLSVRGQYLLPLDFANATVQPAAVSFSLEAPNAGDYWATADDPNRVTGYLQASGQVDYREGLSDGTFQFYGSDLRARNMVVQEVSASGTTAGNTVYLNDLTASLNEKDYVRASGTFGVQQPYPYSGALNVQVANLSTFESLLRATGNQTRLGGSLAVQWQGTGTVEDFRNTGTLDLRLDNGRYGDLRQLEARVEANYTPDALNVPIVFFSSDKMMVQAVAQTRGPNLEISKLEVVQDKAKYAGGYVSIPFVWTNLGSDRPVLPPDGEVVVGIESSNLDIAKLARDFGQKVPVAGLATVKIDASGTLQNLRATLDLQLTGLRSEQLRDFTPATFGLLARIENNQLLIEGTLAQARIAPVEIRAQLPFNVPRIVEERGLADSTPVSGSVRMARTSTNFIRQFVPGLLTADGDIAINVDLGGTIGRPALSGSTDINLNVARFTNPTLPQLSAFRGRIAFAGDTVTLQQFRGDLAGGPFTVTGRIVLPRLTAPVFDLQLRADAVLVARNDNLTARADANIRVNGPLASAAVTGNVALTNSRFLKNIDIIPIGLPGRPAPRPQPPRTQEAISLPPLMSGWTFDVGITTKDDFLIRGNLANGGAIVNMRLAGTGAQPAITGQVRLRDVEATLPFSRLTIDQGFLYFDAGEPMNPRLEIQGTSLIRDYTIRVFVYGTANNPEAVFTSQPPLPQEEIISLLATGTTREELLSGGNVLAGRAAILLFQQLYRNIFKRGDPDAGQTSSLFERLDLDVGQVDPRTGQQSATARYRINRRWMVIGTVGVGGDFRGVVRYVLQFR